jgi:uncharacterized membrane protein
MIRKLTITKKNKKLLLISSHLFNIGCRTITTTTTTTTITKYLKRSKLNKLIESKLEYFNLNIKTYL